MGIHFDLNFQIFFIKMKLLVLLGTLAMILAASAQEDGAPPPVIEREESMIEPTPEMGDYREEDFDDVPEIEELMREEEDYEDRDEDGDVVPPEYKDDKNM